MQIPIVYPCPYQWELIASRQRGLMEAMAEIHPVIFLNSPIWRGGKFEIRKPRTEKIHDNLTIVHDCFGFRDSKVGRRLGQTAAKVDAAWIHAIFRRMGVQEYLYFLGSTTPKMLWAMQTDRLVFDCIDPCFNPKDQEMFDAIEKSVATKARLIFCTAETLLEKMKTLNPNSYLLSNAAESNAFGPNAPKPEALPKPLEGRPRPIVGCLGTIDWRFDPVCITYAARMLPEYTFVLAGRVNADQEEKVRELRALPNVVMPGLVPLSEGPAYNAAFDVGLIPFTPGPMNDAINSVKMYMYLIAGKPVVSTWVRECYRHAPLVSATRTPEEFTEAIRREVTENSEAKIAERIAFAMRNTWLDRAKEALQVMQANGLLS